MLYISGIATSVRYAGIASVKSLKSISTTAEIIKKPTKISAGAVANPGMVVNTGARMIDTPGMRELGMWDSGSGIDQAFGEIEELASCCRFKDCTHHNEPGCAVQRALQDGSLSEERWLSYLKLKAENDYAADSQSYLAGKEKKFKEIAKINKSNRKR